MKGLLRRIPGLFCLALLTGLPGLLGAQQGVPAIPAPRGMLNDFAKVIPSEQAARIEALAADVRAKSGGEIAIVPLGDLAGRDVGDVALRIGREWKVGANAKIGDTKRNAGVVILVVPKESSKDGRGHVGIQNGQGSEGFITDGQTGDIVREAIPLMQRLDYGDAVYLMTERVAERFASNFGFSLDSGGLPPPRGEPNSRRITRSNRTGGFPPQLVFFIFVLLLLLFSRGRGSGCLWLALSSGGRGGGWSGGGGGFGGGGGGGGFGGFGGGGGFSGGGSSGSW